MEENRLKAASQRLLLNSHYGLDCCGWDRPWTKTIDDILPKRRVNTPQVFYISSANYTDATKFLLEGVAKRFTKRPPLEESFFKLADNDEMTEFIKSITNSDGFVCQSNDIAIKFVPTGGDWQEGKPDTFTWCIDPIENNKVCRLETEETKMEAKKCERCGKLYEMKDADDCIAVYMPGIPVSDWNKENFTESRIRKDNTRVISINFRGGEIVDLCPECREKLKNFFESGRDSDIVIKPAEEI